MNIINVWMALTPQKKIMSILSVIVTVVTFYFLVNTTLKPKTSLLYSGLDPAAAGEIVAKLETMDVVYEVKGNAIYADESRRDSLRLELAKDGLPRQSVVGYELFDDMNSFAMTSEMFDTAYWRAKEGELARTLLAMPNIRGARVHLGTQKSKGFSTGPSANSASVTLSAPGGISAEQAKAIQYITALSVSGLKPSDVAVIDTSQGVIAGPGLDGKVSKGGMGELERAAEIKRSLINLLEARVGLGNARVNVSLDIEREHITMAERSFDPDTRVVKSQTSNETTDNNTGTTSSVTVASNLPEGEAGGENSTSDRSETSETVTYEISEIVKNTEILPGGIKRITVAVLVSDVATRNDDGSVTQTPRPDTELQALQELVATAAGLDEARGDKLTLRSLSFDQPIVTDLIEKPSLMAKFLERYLWSTIQAGILAIVVLVLGLFVVRPLLTQTGYEPVAGLEPLSLSNNGEDIAGLASENLGELPLLEMTPNISANNNGLSDPIEQLKSITAGQTTDAADLLASWLEQDNRAAG
ncbi:MAG: flagellar basal-body MS-ring/collar protein FliF [Maricaulaceae bacterium]